MSACTVSHGWKAWEEEPEAAGHKASMIRKREPGLSLLSFSGQLEAPADGKVPPTFWVCLLTSVSPTEKLPARHVQSVVHG